MEWMGETVRKIIVLLKELSVAQRRAFTLIELLVVIAIIALLLAILVPSLSLVKRKAASAVCLVNFKNLALGWYMYQEENDGRLVSATMEAQEDIL